MFESMRESQDKLKIAQKESQEKVVERKKIDEKADIEKKVEKAENNTEIDN